MNKLIKQLKDENPELNKFLVDRRLRSAFLRNYQNCPFPIKYQNFKSIKDAFLWADAPEGVYFWSNLYIESINK